MGNHGTFNKNVKQILIDKDFIYHIFYLIFCLTGLLVHPLVYSILVSLSFSLYINRQETRSS